MVYSSVREQAREGVSLRGPAHGHHMYSARARDHDHERAR